MEKLTAGDPQRIGAYRLLARLGAGRMGQVYLARSDRGRTVAVKLVREELAEQDEFRDRFRLEVAAARRVGGAWTAPVLDANTEAAVPWIATGYVAGPALQEIVSGPHGPLPARSVRILGSGLAHAVADIHSAGLIHRDLTPSNVLLTVEGPKVIDFGMARALATVTDAGPTRTGGPVGSPGFMAPEQVRGDPITPACDVFCLGSVLAYAATGRLPFGTADTAAHVLMFRIAQEEPDLSELPQGLRELVDDCLKKDPTRRPTPAQILARVGEPDEGEPWLPGALLAQLGDGAGRLPDHEEPGARTAPVGAPPPSPEAARPPQPQPPPPPPRQPAQLPQLPPQYGYPRPGQPPLPPWGATPPPGHGYPSPYGSTPPSGPTPVPRPERARRGTRGTVALIAVALVVALGAGGSVYAFMDSGSEKNGSSDDKPPGDDSALSEDASPVAGTPSPSATEGAGAGDVPKRYLGAWSGTIDGATGRNTRELSIRQGKVGDTVLVLTAEGPTGTGGTYRCVFKATLGEAPGSGSVPLRIGPSTIATGRPMTFCAPGAATELTILPDGRLRRVTTADGESVTYTKDG